MWEHHLAGKVAEIILRVILTFLEVSIKEIIILTINHKRFFINILGGKSLRNKYW